MICPARAIVSDAIRFYYEEKNDASYLERCQAPLQVAGEVASIVAGSGAEIDFESDPFWPAYTAQLRFETCREGSFIASFTSTIAISKLGTLFHVAHFFEVENHHHERVEPSLFGHGNTGYIMKQLELHEALRQRLVGKGYTELDLADMAEVLPSLSFPEGVTLFGRQVSVEFALFHDLRGLCPEG